MTPQSVRDRQRVRSARRRGRASERLNKYSPEHWCVSCDENRPFLHGFDGVVDTSVVRPEDYATYTWLNRSDRRTVQKMLVVIDALEQAQADVQSIRTELERLLL